LRPLTFKTSKFNNPKIPLSQSHTSKTGAMGLIHIEVKIKSDYEYHYYCN